MNTNTINPMDITANFLEQAIGEHRAFDMSAAEAFAITSDGIIKAGSHPDIYDLLTDIELPKGSTGILIHTTGWAAPLTENGEVEGAPSQHPLRRRVALVTCAMDDADGKIVSGSTIGFADDPTDLVSDPGSATGSLANALVLAWARAKDNAKGDC